MSRFRQLNALETSPPARPADCLSHATVPILNGADGFVAYCLGCDRRVTPGYWPRATLAVALVDRDTHMESHP